MASSNQTPDVLFSPIAVNADASDINTIPQTYDPENYGYAAQNIGFPTECRLPVKNPDGTLGQGRAPRMQDWNGIMKLVSSHNFFLQNGGSYTFNPTVSANLGGYPKNAVLWYFPENEDPCLVYSLINDNTNNFVDDPALIDGEHWKKLSLGGGGGEIGDMGFAPLGIDETLNLRRYLNGQVISQSQFASFTTKLKAAVALYPSLSATEANWQSEKSLSKLGQCGKFVIDDDAGTIRLPCVVNAQSLADLQYLGTLKSESLPNITGGTNIALNEPVATGSFKNSDVAKQGKNTLGTAGTYKELLFDASRSSSTYQDNAPVQQEAVQYPYYIQVATGVEETLPAIREYKTNVPYVLGDSKYFEANPYNASWLVSNGQYNAKTTYPDMWTQLQVELNSSLNEGDTVVIDGKTYVKRGLPVVLSTGTITDYDFVINTADETFRLPLRTKLASGSAVVGNGMTLGLTDGTRNFGLITNVGNAGGRFYLGQSNNAYGSIKGQASGANSYDNPDITAGITTDPTKSGIETSSNGLKLYYYVGDTVQDASLINAGAVLGQLANVNAASRGYLVDSYQNGTDWYRIYSDGWKEQGGDAITPAASQAVRITFLKPFTAADAYSVGMLPFVGNISVNNLPSPAVQVRQTTYMECSVGSYEFRLGSVAFCWYACGY